MPKGLNERKLPMTKDYNGNAKKLPCGDLGLTVPFWDSSAAKAVCENREREFFCCRRRPILGHADRRQHKNSRLAGVFPLWRSVSFWDIGKRKGKKVKGKSEEKSSKLDVRL
ncbi:MAG TPA: hypothetical protein VMZ49_02950 [Patescibacteria group bacterium]|nr:hypothetical protein [Patescibacteria group bacterium]